MPDHEKRIEIAKQLFAGWSSGDVDAPEPFMTPDAVLNDGISGEPFSCDDFTTENGPGILVFAAPQLNLPVFGDAITQFRFSDK